MEMISKVGSALRDIKREGAEKVGGALQDLKREGAELASKLSQKASPSREKPDELKELRELALEYSWDEMRRATDDFSEARRLGSGASGTVFRGTLQEGIDVAVKIIEGLVGGGFEEEVRLLSKCRHPNVVMLLGFAREDDGSTIGADAVPSGRRALVYELLPGGDVEARLLKNKGPAFLWRDRLRTAIDIARGLAHIHKHRPEIFHRDIKPPNVLFGADGAARIADFGLACVSKKHGARELTVDVAAGTPGYADPLYAQTGVVTEASEVYSMGMVLVQLLTRRPPALVSPDGKTMIFLLSEIRPERDGAKERLLQMLDAQARWPTTAAITLANLALLCIHEDADQRPSFMDLAAVLQDLAEGANEDAKPTPAPLRSSATYAPAAAEPVVRGLSFGQAAPQLARGASFGQAAPMAAQAYAAGHVAGQQLSDAWPSRSPSVCEPPPHDAVRPLDDSRIRRGASLLEGSSGAHPYAGSSAQAYASGQGAHPYAGSFAKGSSAYAAGRCAQPHAGGYADAGYAYAGGQPFMPWGAAAQQAPAHAGGYGSALAAVALQPRCAEVYLAAPAAQPVPQGASMYVRH